MSVNFPAAKAIHQGASERFSIARSHTSLWQQGLVFFLGFCIQFNMLIGGGEEGASATGGYGYRLIDFVALGIACLLGIHSLVPRRILPLALYGLVVGVLFLPALAVEPRTALLVYHYLLYSFAALYVVVLLSDIQALDRFCWGLIIGLLATVPIFVLQNSGWSGTLVDWGLMPGYAITFNPVARDIPRYAGLWAHPNEAGHVATLAAAAGAYFAFARRRLLPLALVAAGLLAVFYYTWCRGALLAGGAVLAIPFVISRSRTRVLRLMIMFPILILAVALVSQFDFVASRFEDDPNASNNVAERLASILGGLKVMLANPFGMSISDFLSFVASGSGGVGSPHNGFIFLGGILGLLPLSTFLVACAANLRVRDDTDVFFALFTLQVSLSFLFEQLPGSFSYAFAICLIGAKAFLRTRLGGEFKTRSVQVGPRNQH